MLNTWDFMLTVFPWIKVICSLILSNIMQSLDEITERSLTHLDSPKVCKDFVCLVMTWLTKLKVLFRPFNLTAVCLLAYYCLLQSPAIRFCSKLSI